jgi:hypothetical protein
MYEQQQRQRGNPKGIHSRDGCGLQFSDTKGTPFTNWKLPLGLVFLAVYCPAGQIEKRLIQLGEEEHCQALRQALKGLQQKQHAWLARRMQQYANLFCGQLVLKHCPQLVRKSEQARVLTRLAAERILPLIRRPYKKRRHPRSTPVTKPCKHVSKYSSNST